MNNQYRKQWGSLMALAGLLLAAAPAGRAQNATSDTVKAVAAPLTTHTLQNNITTRTLASGAALPAERERFVVSNVTTASLKSIAQETALRNAEVTPLSGKGLRFNFRGVSLDTVLDYLGKAAGFTIVREASVTGRIDVYSEKSLDKEEAVQILHTVLQQKGLGAVLSENTLRIVTLDQMSKKDIPVIVGNDPSVVKKTDEMVNQIIQVRYANATQLIKNLEPLLPSYATISSNDSSNAVILTATKTDIKRLMEIIKALDTSLTTGSNLKVFMLNQASATDIAKLITDLFKPPTGASGSSGSNSGRPSFPFPPMMFGRGGDRGGDRGGRGGGDSSSGGRATAYQVTAVADERTNAVVVSAPEEMMTSIEELIKQVDQSITQIQEIRVFPLKFAEAQMMAQLINEVFQSSTQSQSSSGRGGSSPVSFFMSRMMGGGSSGSSGSPTNRRNGQQPTVYATADIRTNAVVVNADKELMEQVVAMIEQLDNDPAKDRKVFVYPLKYADPQKTSEVLESMFGTTSGRSSSSNRNSNSGGIFGTSTNNNSNSRTNSRSNSGRSVPGGLGN